MTFLRTYLIEICVAAILSIVLLVSLSTLLTKPRLWTDEAVTLELARNMHEHGSLNALPAPGSWYEAPYVLQSTGYPVTLSLAVVFSLFDYGFTQARVLMLAWMLAALVMCFLLMRSLFTKEIALGSVLSLATFASFHANGRTATGEIPGFAFLMAGLYFFLAQKNLWLAGALWGLAVVSKPSVFVVLIPTITLTLLLQQKPFWERVRDVFRVGIAMVPAGALWIFLIIPEPFSIAAWQTIFGFLVNPYAAAQGTMPSLVSLLLQPTIAYFALWFAALALAFRALTEPSHRVLYVFVGIFSTLAFLYYLRSPGWLRYFLIAELLMLVLLPSAFHALQIRYVNKLPQFFARFGAAFTVGCIALFQIMQFNSADIYTSHTSLRVANYVNAEYPNASTLSLGHLGISVLLNTDERYTYIRLEGIAPLGEPLSESFLPDVVIVEDAEEGTNYYPEAQAILNAHYRIVQMVGAAGIYTRNK